MSGATVTVHMAASLDGFIARLDGSVGWLETSDRFEAGEDLTPGIVAEFLKSIDCYVMGSRTYETALRFVEAGHGWAYGDKPTFVLTTRTLPKVRPTVEFLSGDLRQIVEQQLKPRFANIWIAGGGALCGECLRLGLADEVRLSLMPVLIGEGIPFFKGLANDVALHLKELKAYKSGIVALRHEVIKKAQTGPL
jgi:dihydrofolate reductase